MAKRRAPPRAEEPICCFRPALLDQVPLDRHAVIEASAGTGKTHLIAQLVVELLLARHVPLEQVLILTYTERAAAELRRKVRSMIVGLLATTQGTAEPGQRGWVLEAAARRRLERALLSFDLATVDTIHAFFQRVLLEHAFLGGRPLVQTLEDGRSLFARAFKTALRRDFARDAGLRGYLLGWLDGRGVEDLEKLLYECHSRHRDVHPTYSAEELRGLLISSPLLRADEGVLERLRTELKQLKVNANTIKALVTRLGRAREIAAHHAADPLPGVLDSKLREEVEWVAAKLEDCSLTDAAAAELADHLRVLRGALVSFEAAVVQTFLPRVAALLHEEKRAHGPYDFDDMISLVGEFLAGPGGGELLGHLRARYRYALIDEFQDTDDRQWAVFRRVFLDSDRRNLLYLIGDPKQAIYGFRGADVYTYLRARGEVSAAEGNEAVPLRKNYRSTGPLIEAYNRIFDQGAAEPFFTGEIRYDHPAVCGLRDSVAHDAAGRPVAPVHLFRFTPGEKNAGVTGLRRAFGRRIAREAARLLTPEGALHVGPADAPLPVRPGDIYVLTATGREGVEVGGYLREAGVPHAFYKQEGLFQTTEADDIRDLLAAVEDPQDPSRRLRAWITPFFAVPLAALPRCLQLPPGHPFLGRLLAWQELAAARDFETLFAQAVEESGLLRRERFLKESERELTNYLHLFELLLEEARRTGGTLATLLRTLQGLIDGTRQPLGENGNVQRLEGERAAVQIMTIHKSKGLEAAVVFVYGGFTAGAARRGSLYEYQEGGRRVLYVGASDPAKAKAEEERCKEYQRLLYVAVTRARARLYLPYVDPDDWDGKWDGCYRGLNRRLGVLVQEMARGEHAELFAVEDIHDEPTPDADPEPGEDRLASWKPDAKLLELPDDSAVFARLCRQHAACEVTSYSRMRRAAAEITSPHAARELRQEPVRPAPPADVEEPLPGGIAVGNFLHEALEVVPFTGLAGPPPFDAWCRDDAVVRAFRDAAARHAIAPQHVPEGQRLVYHALTTPVTLGPEAVVHGLASCERAVREVEFVYPFPEVAHPRLGDLPATRLAIGRGYVQGFVDLVFTHAGRVYFADWKSDVLPSYAPEALGEHVGKHYRLQILLYSLALVKMLGVRGERDYEERFGGLLYVFLRGLRAGGADGAGTYFDRPSWRDVLGYEQELLGGTAAGEDHG